MVVEMNYNYDTKFEGNILVVRRTGCGKTTFVQNLEKNKMFEPKRSNLGLQNIAFKRLREAN